jgi:lysophospholipase L1-like esterase
LPASRLPQKYNETAETLILTGRTAAMPDRMAWAGLMALVPIVLSPACGHAQEPRPTFKFTFAPGRAAPGYVQVTPEMTYDRDRGFGFEPGARVRAVDRGGPDALRGGFVTADRPLHFSVAVPEGNYRVTLVLGDARGESATTVKAELRRLMLERVATPAGKFETRTFVVNVRTPRIAGNGQVRLKDREKSEEGWAWDEKLTLEFNGERPCLCALEVVPADDVTTVYVLGDSTVCDQPREPYASWGQMLPRFFGPKAAVANHAESGESLRSSRGARRLDKVLSVLRPGDYLFLQYGHNDMKSVDAAAFKAELRRFAAAAREKGGRVVLVTPMHRRTFEGRTVVNSHKDFPDAVRELAREEGLALIDLHAMSKTLYEALGPEGSGALFKAGDGTHHSPYGAYLLARCVVEGIRQNQPELAKLLADDVAPFDPARPEPVDQFRVPASPSSGPATKPEGN